MKRNSLTTSVVAGIAGVAGIASLANAVVLNPDGLGQVLLYPYFTTQAHQQTLISVVNTTSISKAVKVRFLEGHNSREVLDFNLYLSPFDVWTSTVFKKSDASLAGDGAAILTSDQSCTAPTKDQWTGTVGGNPYQEFFNYQYNGTNADTGPTGDSRTLEGHLELISMADIVPGSNLDQAVTHVAGVPDDCDYAASIIASDPDLLPPTGGLFGAGAIVNGAQGTFYTYNADAIDGFTVTALFYGTSSLFPSLAQANTSPIDATAYVFNNGQLITSNYTLANAVDAVSAVFAQNAIFNEYNVDSAAGSNTDWVVTFPTKRFYVDPAIIGAANPAIAPFSFRFGQNVTGNGLGLSCTQIGISQWDREEGHPTVTVGFSPPPPGQPASSLCKESNVISFLNVSSAPSASGVLGSTLVTNVKPFAKTGWMRLDLDPAGQPHAMRPSVDLDVYHGLPATGFEAVNYVNGNVTAGVLANYSGLFRHRGSRNCTNTGTGACS